jgi:hypothetical protein
MSDTNTNTATLPDFNAFFKNQGKPIGYVPTDAEMELAKAVLVPVTKELVMRQFAPPEGAAKLGTRTNEITKDVLRTIEYPDGSFKPYEVPQLQTTDGYQEMFAPGTARTITNVTTGAPARGYVASGSIYGVNQPVVGGDNSAARAAAAAATGGSPAPTQAPQSAPAPKPYTMTNAEGAVMTFTDPYQVRAALDRGELTLDEARKAALQFPLPGRTGR